MTTTIPDAERKPLSCTFWRSRRFLLGLLGFLGFYNAFALRVNLHIAIITMTKNETILSEDGNNTLNVRRFDWSFKEQGYILSSFYYGYILTHIPGGWLAARCGGKIVFGIGIAGTSLLALITPIATEQNFYLLIIVRILQGMFSGITFPSYFGLISHWAPPSERNRLIGIPLSGSLVAIVITLPLTANLSEAFGWKSSFYIFGLIGLLWYASWIFIVAESPAEDVRISAEELDYIQGSLIEQNLESLDTPRRQIFKCRSLWAISVAHFCETWGLLTISTQMARFMNDVLHFEVDTTGLFSALPYIATVILYQISSTMGDWLKVKGNWRAIHIRRLYTSGGLMIQGLCMAAVTFAHTPVATMIFLTPSVGFSAFPACGFNVNYIDIAPNHVSILKGIGSSFGHVPGILTPILTGYLVATGSKLEWDVVFYINTGLCFIGALVYWWLSSDKVQDWATIKDNPSLGN